MTPLLIIIQGAPGSGKSTLAHKLHRDLGIGIVSGDDVKEYFFDTIGHGSKTWSHELGKSVKPYLYNIVELTLAAGMSVIYESAFHTKFAKVDMAKLLSKVEVDAIELYCFVDERVRKQRFDGRLTNNERHPGHIDTAGILPPLELYEEINVCETIHINTGHFGDEDYRELKKTLAMRLMKSQGGK